jgi:alpha-glucosidase
MVRLAAKNHLMINIHDEFRPAGFSRTYPNLLNQEGIRGNEEFPDATHNTILPFTRMINGAADYTICYFDKRLKVTHGHQLAASMIYYGPLQVLYWYDTPSRVQDVPELKWFDELPTVWDETHILEGEPGSHVVMARRKGTDWYVAAMTNTEARTISISTGFLNKGEKYVVECYNDNPAVDSPTHVECSLLNIRAGKKPIVLNLQPSGGAVLHLKNMK